MGQTSSAERKLFIDIITCMLKKRGTAVTRSQVARFLHFVQEQCPWFPEGGSVNLDIWKAVGEQLQKYYTRCGPEGVPVDAFALWMLIRDTLDPTPDSVKAFQVLDNPDSDPTLEEEETPLLQKHPSVASTPSAPPFVGLSNPITNDTLSPEEQVDLEEEAARYHQDEDIVLPLRKLQIESQPPKYEVKSLTFTPRNRVPLPPPPPSLAGKSKIKAALKQGLSEGDVTLPLCFPVHYSGEFDEDAEWTPLSYKFLKEVKNACKEYGPLSPYTLSLIDILSTSWMTPYDWYQLAKTCLPGGSFLLWKMEKT